MYYNQHFFNKRSLSAKSWLCVSVFALSTLILPGYSRGQVDTRLLENRYARDTSARLEVQVGVLGFVKNNEYFNPYTDGYTLWGTQLAPAVAYRIAPKAMLRGGIFWRNDFGETRKARPEPTLTLKISHRNWHYIFGTLEGNLNHRLVEPLYNYERYLRSPVENGLQVNHSGQKLFFDFWISYPRNTLPGYDRQESFWGGLSARTTLAQNETNTLDVLAQATVFHAGGQGIRSPLPVRTATNATLGLRYRRAFPAGWVRAIRLEPYWLGYAESARSGRGWYPNATLETRPLNVMLSYWRGQNYRAEYGGDLYKSDSQKNPGYFEPDRSWLMVRLVKTVDLGGGLILSVRAEPTLDLRSRKIEHSEGIYLSYLLREGFLKRERRLF